MTSAKAIQRKRLEEKLTRECGPLIMEALRDPRVIEIMLNPDGRLWLDIAGKGMRHVGKLKGGADSMLATCASMLHTSITFDDPILEGEFPLDGSRLQGLIPPIVQAPTFAIRKRASCIFTLDAYAEAGIIRPLHLIPDKGNHHGRGYSKGNGSFTKGFLHPVDAIRSAVAGKKNILIVGGTGSGKTTLANAVLHEISLLCPHDRVVAIEDTIELQTDIENHVLLRTSETVNMQRLLRATMRLRPDRIIVGEVRGAEAYTLLKSWNSGHPGGVATIHANSAAEGLDKLAHYIYESRDAQNFSPDMISRMIASAVNLVLFIEKMVNEQIPGRIVGEICEVKGFNDGNYQLEPIKEIQHVQAIA
jgi:type IV secretion system protein TrbB